MIFYAPDILFCGDWHKSTVTCGILGKVRRPIRPPVHLHNVATCHMETGITNLCLPLVALCPSCLRSLFCVFLSFFSPYYYNFLLYFIFHGAFFLSCQCENLQTKFWAHLYIKKGQSCTKPGGCRGGLGTACQHQLWGSRWHREGLILMW